MNLNLIKPAVLAAGILLAGSAGAQEKFNSEAAKVSYALGMDIGKNLKDAHIDSLDIEMIAEGLRDVLKNNITKLTADQTQDVISSYLMRKKAEMSTKQQKAGLDFLAANAKRKGVITLPSGLQYEIITAGKGQKPTIDDKVTTHYTGTLIDGTVFDSSVERNEPATFPVGQVIRGWTEALQLMPVGSKWKLYIPSNLAYGDQGAGGVIGPNETLVFEIELLSISK
jgi:FKBP-type peptidyl-prolyl cis-trans isomerase FklB